MKSENKLVVNVLTNVANVLNLNVQFVFKVKEDYQLQLQNLVVAKKDIMIQDKKIVKNVILSVRHAQMEHHVIAVMETKKDNNPNLM